MLRYDIYRNRADIAQLVEQLIRNEQVVGSNPIVSSIVNSRLPRFSEVFLFSEKNVFSPLFVPYG